MSLSLQVGLCLLTEGFKDPPLISGRLVCALVLHD